MFFKDNMGIFAHINPGLRMNEYWVSVQHNSLINFNHIEQLSRAYMIYVMA